MQSLSVLLVAALLAGSQAEVAAPSQAVNLAPRAAPAADEVAPDEGEPIATVEVELPEPPAPSVESPPVLRQPDGTDWSEGVHVDPDMGLARDVTPGNFGLL